MTFNREWVALLLLIFIFIILLFSTLLIFYVFLWLLTGSQESIGLVIQIIGCAQASTKLNLIIFLIDVPMAMKLVELMLQGWTSQPTLEKRLFFNFFYQLLTIQRENKFHSCLSHLNFAEGAIILTLLIFKPIFWASHPKKHRNRVHDHDSDLQTIFWKISLFLHI